MARRGVAAAAVGDAMTRGTRWSAEDLAVGGLGGAGREGYEWEEGKVRREVPISSVLYACQVGPIQISSLCRIVPPAPGHGQPPACMSFSRSRSLAWAPLPVGAGSWLSVELACPGRRRSPVVVRADAPAYAAASPCEAAAARLRMCVPTCRRRPPLACTGSAAHLCAPEPVVVRSREATRARLCRSCRSLACAGARLRLFAADAMFGIPSSASYELRQLERESAM